MMVPSWMGLEVLMSHIPPVSLLAVSLPPCAKAAMVQGVSADLTSRWWDMGGGKLSRSKYQCPMSASGSAVGLVPLPLLCGLCREVGTSEGIATHPNIAV